MPLAYFDCFSGVAGDMIIGALLDAGLPFGDLKGEIEKIGLSGYEISARKVAKNNIEGTKFSVEIQAKQAERTVRQITKIIKSSRLDPATKEKSIRIFNRLAEAEAIAHGESIDKVHFHEVGTVDAIIDICGAVVSLKMLGIEKVYSSSLPLGKGSITTSHGQMPVPAPATATLVKGVPVRITNIDWELTTPTGAAILTTLASFSDPGEFVARHTGYGAGTKYLSGLPNFLRVMIGDVATGLESDTVMVLETNLDRATPEVVGGIIDDLLSAGALDAYIIPTVMKKNRPAHLLSVLCEPDKRDKLAKVIFESGKTLGIRVSSAGRVKLARKQITVATSGGDVAVKVAEQERRKYLFPEYDDMVKAMKKTNLGYDDIYFEIQQAVRKGVSTRKE